eukprot:GHVR01118733.1.p1 GENE.GHVR01118733.1~~GHVR01118733.1.p1  ORF type:complete len:291 (+),score=54.58 GHVR01118733.1:70-942(+)
MSVNSVTRFLSKCGKEVWGTTVGIPTGFAREVSITAPVYNPLETVTSEQWTGKYSFQLAEKMFEIQRRLPPLPSLPPPVIFCIGLNYKAHALETEQALPRMPVVFLKSPMSITPHMSHIVIPSVAKHPPEVDFEGEMAVVLSSSCSDVEPSDAMQHVLGYCVANDVTGRRWQGRKSGGQWCRAKSFDTFCPIGPDLTLNTPSVNPEKMEIKTTLNGELMQCSNTSDMLFTVSQLVSFISQGTTLPPGTVILTGTPAGVGFTRKPPVYLKSGDEVTVSIEGVGALTNYVMP